MTTPGDPRDPYTNPQPLVDPFLVDPVVPSAPVPAADLTGPGPEPVAIPRPAAPASPPPPLPSSDEGRESGGGPGKLKAAALLAGAATLANKVRQDAPRKVQELREKRAAGRYVILTEVTGGAVAVGPYPDEQAARQDLGNVRGVPRVVELLSPGAYAASEGFPTTP